MLGRLISSRKFILPLFWIVAVCHLVFFTKYSYSVEVSQFTIIGEKLKAFVPVILMLTILPNVRDVLDKLLTRFRYNLISILFILMCLSYQIANVPGQAWSTVAFSGLLILVLFNNIMVRYKISQTTAIVFSFMAVWAGWVIFEYIFQIGLLYYHPLAFGGDTQNFFKVMLMLFNWLVPALLYIFLVKAVNKKYWPKIKAGNYKYALALLAICATATTIWFTRDMLIPLPIGENGLAYALDIKYWTADHLDFSISRLSQISIMSIGAILFYKKGSEV